MRIIFKLFLSILLVFVFTSEAYCECLSQEESYTKYVLNTALSRSVAENDKSINLLKKHLLCYPDKEVYYKLAVIYEYSGKYYLASIAYKKAGKVDEIKRLEQLSAQYGKAGENMFKSLSRQKAADYSKSFQEKKVLATALHIIGPLAFATGLSLFIHDKAGGRNSPTAQHALMLGGLTMIASGTILNSHADEHLLLSRAYKSMSEDTGVYYGLTPDEYFASSGGKAGLYRGYSGKYVNRGLALIFISIPLITFSILGSFDVFIYMKEYSSSEGSAGSAMIQETIPGCLALFLTLTPAVFSIVVGARMMARGSKWGTLNTEPSLFTLNSVTPIINPISKTYGLALGFSF